MQDNTHHNLSYTCCGRSKQLGNCPMGLIEWLSAGLTTNQTSDTPPGCDHLFVDKNISFVMTNIKVIIMDMTCLSYFVDEKKNNNKRTR